MRYDMPIVETSRCILRPLEESDACDMYAYCSDEDVVRYTNFTPHRNVNYTLHYIRQVMLPYAQLQDFETWAITLKEHDIMIGDIQLHSCVEDNASVGYMLHKAYWNQGIMKEVLEALLNVAFTRCGLRRIEALYEAQHAASGRVLAGCGFRVEGLLKQYTTCNDGRYHDMVLCAILKEEWIGENI